MNSFSDQEIVLELSVDIRVIEVIRIPFEDYKPVSGNINIIPVISHFHQRLSKTSLDDYKPQCNHYKYNTIYQSSVITVGMEDQCHGGLAAISP
jgi:hypothetical protein